MNEKVKVNIDGKDIEIVDTIEFDGKKYAIYTDGKDESTYISSLKEEGDTLVFDDVTDEEISALEEVIKGV